MGHPTKVQLIQRKKSADQYYINFPTAIAEALQLGKGEIVEWIIEDKANMILHRPDTPASPVTVKKTLRHSSKSSNASSLQQPPQAIASAYAPYRTHPQEYKVLPPLRQSRSDDRN